VSLAIIQPKLYLRSDLNYIGYYTQVGLQDSYINKFIDRQRNRQTDRETDGRNCYS